MARSRPPTKNTTRARKNSTDSSRTSRKGQAPGKSGWFRSLLGRAADDFGKGWALAAFGAPTSILVVVGWYFSSSLSQSFLEARYDIKHMMSVAKSYELSGYKAFRKQDTFSGHHNYGQAASIFRELAHKGYGEAAYKLGKLACVGWGIEKNPEMAALYFRTANLTFAQKERLSQIEDFRDCYRLAGKQA